ncbi:MAG TPA: SPW repeat protein [Hanamia sp.]|nr:SPW repeat protein [Hanamia sp.]
MKRTLRWQDWIIMVIGIWVFITPWVFGFYDKYFAWCPFVTGALLAIFSIWELSNKRLWEEWVNLIIAAWMFISPWVLGFSRTANNASFVMFLFGAIAFVVTLWSIVNDRIFIHPPTTHTTQSS